MMIKFASSVFDISPLIVIHLVNFASSDRIPSEKINIFGVKVVGYSFLHCIVVGKSSPTQKFLRFLKRKLLRARSGL